VAALVDRWCGILYYPTTKRSRDK